MHPLLARILSTPRRTLRLHLLLVVSPGWGRGTPLPLRPFLRGPKNRNRDPKIVSLMPGLGFGFGLQPPRDRGRPYRWLPTGGAFLPIPF